MIALDATLALADGQLVDATTGAVIPADDPAAIPPGIVQALDTYARARVEADALALRMADIEAPHLAAYQAGLDADPEYRAVFAQQVEARRVLEEIEASLDALLPERSDAVSLDTGRVRVTWGKPRSSWTLARPASFYATGGARAALAGLVGDDAADRVLAWLAPTEKVGDVPPVRLTVRGGGA